MKLKNRKEKNRENQQNNKLVLWKINKTDKPLARLKTTRIYKLPIPWMKQAITTDTANIKRIIRQCNEQSMHKFEF